MTREGNLVVKLPQSDCLHIKTRKAVTKVPQGQYVRDLFNNIAEDVVSGIAHIHRRRWAARVPNLSGEEPISLYIGPDTLEKFNEAVELLGMNKSQLVRLLVEDDRLKNGDDLKAA